MPIRLDPTRQSDEATELEVNMLSRVVGQDRAIRQIVRSFQVFQAGFAAPGKPLCVLMLAGPTGSGKTKAVESLSESLFDGKNAVVKIDCAEFQQGHEIAKLVGCFLPGTKVLMHDGSVKSIEDIQIGEQVITKDGRPRTVVDSYEYQHLGETIELHIASSNVPIRCTPQHKILAIRRHLGGRPKTKIARSPDIIYDPSKLEWVQAGDLQARDIAVFPRYKGQKDINGLTIDLARYTEGLPHTRFDDDKIYTNGNSRINRYIPVNQNFMRLAGFYVAEGGNSKSRKTINFTLGLNDHKLEAAVEIVQILDELFGYPQGIRIKAREASNRVYFHSRVASLFMADLFGDHTLKKRIPPFFLDLPDSLICNFLDAAILGDGGRTVSRRVDYSTCSETLHSQINTLFRRLGFITNVQTQVPAKKEYSTRYRTYISGSQIERLKEMLPVAGKGISLDGARGSNLQRMSHVDADFIYYQIKSTSKTDYVGPVYDLSVEEDTSYVIGNMTVSNSPPGYLGHKDTEPRITQAILEGHWTDERPRISILLFDEIEKAHWDMYDLLLAILDKGTLTLGDNSVVNFSRTMIFLTSNLGSQEVAKLMAGGMGFSKQTPDADELDMKIYTTTKSAVKQKFSPEFINRLDRIVVFRALTDEHLQDILDIELNRVRERILYSGGVIFNFTISDAVNEFLLREGTDSASGARHLKRAIERHLVVPLSNIVASRQVRTGDTVFLDMDGDTVIFEIDE